MTALFFGLLARFLAYRSLNIENPVGAGLPSQGSRRSHIRLGKYSNLLRNIANPPMSELFEKNRKPLDAGSLASLKVPPHSVEAEQAVLGGLMLDNSV